MKRRRFPCLPSRLAAAIALTVVAAAHAADAPPDGMHTVTLDDFSRTRVRITEIDDRAVRGAAGAVPFDVPVGRLLLVDAPTPAAVDLNGWFLLTRRDGQRLVGKPVEIKDDAIVWRTPSLGESTVPLPGIASIEAAAGKHAAATTSVAVQDEIRLTNGDVLQGIVASSTSDALTVQSADGGAVPVEWKNVRRLRFAQAGELPKAATGRARVTLADGSRVLVDDLKFANGKLDFRVDGRAASVPVDAVTRVENLAGNVRLLADVAPTSAQSLPYFPSTLGRASAEPSDRARALVANGTAASAILARPRSVTTWSLAQSGAAKFHARYLIPPGLPQADVTIRVKADGRVLFERANVRSGEASAPPIDVELGDAKSLTLEVDFGERYDVQDEFYWLDAALILAAK